MFAVCFFDALHSLFFGSSLLFVDPFAIVALLVRVAVVVVAVVIVVVVVAVAAAVIIVAVVVAADAVAECFDPKMLWALAFR